MPSTTPGSASSPASAACSWPLSCSTGKGSLREESRQVLGTGPSPANHKVPGKPTAAASHTSSPCSGSGVLPPSSPRAWRIISR